MTTAPKYMPWTDATGNYPKWLEDYWALMEKRGAEQAARQEPIYRYAADFPLPTLSVLLECLHALRNQPDLMDKIHRMVREYPDLDNIPEDGMSDLAGLIGMFLHWWELKRGQESSGDARSQLLTIVYKSEQGTTHADDADAIRQDILGAFYVDDLADAAGGN